MIVNLGKNMFSIRLIILIKKNRKLLQYSSNLASALKKINIIIRHGCEFRIGKEKLYLLLRFLSDF
jgi:hypothetical protein